MSGQPALNVRTRAPAAADRSAVLDLAPRLTIGVAPWLDPAGALAVARNWIEGSIAGLVPDRAVFVAEDGQSRCVGFISVARSGHCTGEEYAYIGELAVAQEAERRGVGRALVEEAEAWARQRGFRMIGLDTGAANAGARAFYARLGFAEESVKLVKVL